jgi:hypothetical protein
VDPIRVTEALIWGIVGGSFLGWGTCEGARAICSGGRSMAPILGKIAVIGCLYFGISRSPTLWPIVLGAVLVAAAGVIGFALLASRKRLR